MLWLLTTVRVYTRLLATACLMLLRLGPHFRHVLYYRMQHDGRTGYVGVSHVIALRIQLFILFLYGCTQSENGLT